MKDNTLKIQGKKLNKRPKTKKITSYLSKKQTKSQRQTQKPKVKEKNY